MSLTFKYRVSSAVVLVFLKFLIIPDIIIFNHISVCIAFKSCLQKTCNTCFEEITVDPVFHLGNTPK